MLLLHLQILFCVDAVKSPSASTSSAKSSCDNQSNAVVSVEDPLYNAPDDRDRLLKEELTEDNYKEKFHVLLDAEKQEHSVELARR